MMHACRLKSVKAQSMQNAREININLVPYKHSNIHEKIAATDFNAWHLDILLYDKNKFAALLFALVSREIIVRFL